MSAGAEFSAAGRFADLLRLARTAAFRIAGPADAIARRLSGRASLPPLWLRRHTGPPRHFESSAREMAEFLDRLGVLRADDCVLDVGCGAGAMALALENRLGAEGRYVGFDVHAPSIRWCRRRFTSDPRFRFELAGVSSPYGDRSGGSVESYRFPLEDGAADLVLAKSVFTHLMENEARRYLGEIRRVLAPSRGAIVTAFLFDRGAAGGADAARAFPASAADGRVRFRSRMQPTAAVAYDRAFFESLVAEAGARVQWFSPGYFPGAHRPTGQDVLLVVRAEETGAARETARRETASPAGT